MSIGSIGESSSSNLHSLSKQLDTTSFSRELTRNLKDLIKILSGSQDAPKDYVSFWDLFEKTERIDEHFKVEDSEKQELIEKLKQLIGDGIQSIGELKLILTILLSLGKSISRDLLNEVVDKMQDFVDQNPEGLGGLAKLLKKFGVKIPEESNQSKGLSPEKIKSFNEEIANILIKRIQQLLNAALNPLDSAVDFEIDSTPE